MAIPKSEFQRINVGKSRLYVHKRTGVVFSRHTYDNIVRPQTLKSFGVGWDSYKFSKPSLAQDFLRILPDDKRAMIVGEGTLYEELEKYDYDIPDKTYRTIQVPRFVDDISKSVVELYQDHFSKVRSITIHVRG